MYSDGLKAEDINMHISKLEKMVYEYLEQHHCNEFEQINISEEVQRLEEMCWQIKFMWYNINMNIENLENEVAE